MPAFLKFNLILALVPKGSRDELPDFVDDRLRTADQLLSDGFKTKQRRGKITPVEMKLQAESLVPQPFCRELKPSGAQSI